MCLPVFLCKTQTVTPICLPYKLKLTSKLTQYYTYIQWGDSFKTLIFLSFVFPATSRALAQLAGGVFCLERKGGVRTREEGYRAEGTATRPSYVLRGSCLGPAACAACQGHVMSGGSGRKAPGSACPVLASKAAGSRRREKGVGEPGEVARP